MSVQLAKSTPAAATAASGSGGGGSGSSNVGGDNAKQGRRTPLSLSGVGKSTGGGNKNESSTVIEKKTDAVKNNEKSINSSNDVEMKRQQSERKKDETTASALQENGYTNGHKRNDSISSNSSNKNDDKKPTTTSATSENIANLEKPIRESQRNKEKLQKEEKTVSTTSPKKPESTKTNERSSRKTDKDKDGHNEKKDETPVKKTDKKSSQDSVTQSVTKKEQEKKSQESSSELVKVDEKKINQQEPIVIDDERKTQNTQKAGVTSVKKGPGRPSVRKLSSEELETIVLDEEVETPGQPEASSTPGKVIKHKQGPLCGEQKPTEDTSAPDTGVTIVISSKSASYSVVNESSSISAATALPTQISRPVAGRISGRRSIRHLPEYSFENRYPGYYRPIPDDDRWPSSMNVTVGSEIPNESTSSSFSFFSRGKKRERTPPPPSSSLTDSGNTKSSINQIMGSQDSELSPKSPKRARLDFSGFLGIVASPMTMLRAKFSRAKIQLSSTPNGKVKSKRNAGAEGNVDVYGGNEEDVVNVSGIVAEDVTAVIDDDNDDENGVDNIDDDISIHDDEKGNGSKQVINMSDKDTVDIQPDDNKLLDDNDDIIIKEKVLTSSTNDVENKRKMCKVM